MMTSKTFSQIQSENVGKRIIAYTSPCGGISLFVGVQQVEWPNDWPEDVITRQFVEDQGVQVMGVMS
jgi:hypothetical protein